MVPHIHTKDGITVVLNGKPYAVATEDTYFEQVRDAVLSNYDPSAILDIIQSNARKVEEATRLSPNLEYSGGIVYYQGEELHNYAVDKLVELLEANLSVTPLVNFLEKLYQNPSKRVVDDLYRFLEHGKMPLTESGNFLAYKYVRADYLDSYSGKFDNSVGAVNSMPRNRVDEDPNRTCSSGFHVCSYDYLPKFGNGGTTKVMVCEVNPENVVAIPADYNDTKMRVSEYVVVGEVTDYVARDENVLTETPVVEKRFLVYTDDDGWGVDFENARFYTFAEARQHADKLYRSGDFEDVWVQTDDDQYLYDANSETVYDDALANVDTKWSVTERKGCFS